MNVKGRDPFIDIIRGIATILVVVGHIPYTPFLVRAWIYTFHVPLFFLCSGLLFSTQRYPKFKDFLIARVRGLLIPLFSLGIIVRLLQVVISFGISRLPGALPDYAVPLEPVNLILSLVLGWRGTDYYFTFWFLYVLFLGEIVFYFLVKLLKKKWYFYAILIVAGLALQAVVAGFVKGFIWSTDALPACIAFLSAGYLYKILMYDKGIHFPGWLLPIFLAVSFLFTGLNLSFMGGDQVNLFYEQLGNPLFYFFASLSGCAFSICLSGLIKKSRVLEFFGKNSLVTYGFQNPLVIPFMMEVLRFAGLGSDLFQDTTLRWIVTVTGTLLISAALSILINRFAPFLAGRKKQTSTNRKAAE